MTENSSESVRPAMADKSMAEKRDTFFVLAMSLVTTVAFVWYFVMLTLGDVEGAKSLIPLITIGFFAFMGFDQRRQTTSPAMHAVTIVNSVLMCAFALTIVVPLLLK